jgi:hypothetical protein
LGKSGNSILGSQRWEETSLFILHSCDPLESSSGLLGSSHLKSGDLSHDFFASALGTFEAFVFQYAVVFIERPDPLKGLLAFLTKKIIAGHLDPPLFIARQRAG